MKKGLEIPYRTLGAGFIWRRWLHDTTCTQTFSNYKCNNVALFYISFAIYYACTVYNVIM